VRECRKDAGVQLLGEILQIHWWTLYSNGTPSSTSQFLGKCAVFAEVVAFQFSTSVAVNSVAYFNINVLYFIGTRDGWLCRKSAPLFMRWTDKTTEHLVMSPINEEKFIY